MIAARAWPQMPGVDIYLAALAAMDAFARALPPPPLADLALREAALFDMWNSLDEDERAEANGRLEAARVARVPPSPYPKDPNDHACPP